MNLFGNKGIGSFCVRTPSKNLGGGDNWIENVIKWLLKGLIENQFVGVFICLNSTTTAGKKLQ